MSTHSDDSEMQIPYENKIIEEALAFVQDWTNADQVLPHRRVDVVNLQNEFWRQAANNVEMGRIRILLNSLKIEEDRLYWARVHMDAELARVTAQYNDIVVLQEVLRESGA